MYLNQFSVRIPEGREVSGGYVELNHGTQYRLILRNSRSQRCDASVEVDGQHVGTWRIEKHRTITLERPVHDTGHFTFYKVGTPEASKANLDGGNPNLGLVKVTFTPEKYVEPRPLTRRSKHPNDVTWDASEVTYRSTTAPAMGSPASYVSSDEIASSSVTSSELGVTTATAGGTGLSGQSGQRFIDAVYINYDYSQQTVIHLRLVCANGPDEPRPLTSYSTPVPPPVR